MPRQPVDAASCRAAERQNVAPSFVNATSCASRGGKLYLPQDQRTRAKTRGGTSEPRPRPSTVAPINRRPPSCSMSSKTCSTVLPDVRIPQSVWSMSLERFPVLVTCTRPQRMEILRAKSMRGPKPAHVTRRDTAAKRESQSNSVTATKVTLCRARTKCQATYGRLFLIRAFPCKHSHFFHRLLDIVVIECLENICVFVVHLGVSATSLVDDRRVAHSLGAAASIH